MPGIEHDISEEAAMLSRLAQAHKAWRDNRPPPHPLPDDWSVLIAAAWHHIEHPEAQDVEVIRKAYEDPLGMAIWSQLSIVGWRLYAKGGADLLSSIYVKIERDHHPGFAAALQKAWTNLGFPNDARGVWHGTNLL